MAVQSLRDIQFYVAIDKHRFYQHRKDGFKMLARRLLKKIEISSLIWLFKVVVDANKALLVPSSKSLFQEP